MKEEKDYTQEIILKLRGEEISTWKHLMLMSGGFIGFPATLLGTNNLPAVDISLLLVSWFSFVLNIIIGATLLRDTIHLNIDLAWYAHYRKGAEKSKEYLAQIKSPKQLLIPDLETGELRTADEDYLKKLRDFVERKFQKAKQEEEKADKKLISLLYTVTTWIFYTSFILGLIFLALSIIIVRI